MPYMDKGQETIYTPYAWQKRRRGVQAGLSGGIRPDLSSEGAITVYIVKSRQTAGYSRSTDYLCVLYTYTHTHTYRWLVI